MMIFNTKEKTYHPILYFEHPLPSNPDTLIRYKSKGHRTIGFKDRNEAIQTIQPELIDKLPGFNITQELNDDLYWDGIDVPADIQLRSKN